MANKALTVMTSASALTGAELFYSVQGTSDVKVTSSQIYSYVTTVSTLSSPAGGVNGNIQFNSGGVFGGILNSSWDATNSLLSIPAATTTLTSSTVSKIILSSSVSQISLGSTSGVTMQGDTAGALSVSNLGSGTVFNMNSVGQFSVGQNITGGAVGAQFEVLSATNNVAGFSRWTASQTGANINLYHSRSATIGTQAILQSSDFLGAVRYSGSDGIQFLTAASVQGVVDAAPSSGVMPSRLEFYTTTSSGALTERQRIDSAGIITNFGASVNTLFGVPGRLQIQTPVGTSYSLATFGINNNVNGPGIASTKTRGTSPSSHVAVIAGDNLGGFDYGGSDGTSYAYAATWEVIVDGAVALNSVPARFSWRTTPVGGTTATERMRLTSGGSLQLFGGGTLTASMPALDITQTWNNAAIAFTGIRANFTNTASLATSLLLDLQVGGVSKFSVSRDAALSLGISAGGVTSGAGIASLGAGDVSIYVSGSRNFAFASSQLYLLASSPTINLNSDTAPAINFGAVQDVVITRDAAGILAQRNGVNAQTFRVYNTYTDVNNWERGVLDWTTVANTLTIGTQKLGTGTARAVNLTGQTVQLSEQQAGSQINYNNSAFYVSTGNVSLGLAGSNQFIAAHLGGNTVTASAPILDLTQTWNNAAVTFTGIKLNVTNTASAAASMLLDLQVGGSSKFNIDVSGGKLTTSATGFIFNDGSNVFYASDNRGGNAGASLAANASWSWCSATNDATGTTVDTGLARQVAGVVGLVNLTTLTNACGFQVYNTADSRITPTNFERGIFDWTTNANILTIGTQAGGTGTARDVVFTAAGSMNFSFGIPYPTTVVFYLSGGSGYAQLFAGWPLAWGAGAAGPTGTGFDTGIVRVAPGVVSTVTNIATPGASYIQWGGQRRVTTNFTSSSATLTAITGISSAVLSAGRNYAFRAWLAVTGSSLAGVQVGITCSSTTITTLLSDGYLNDAGVSRGSSVGVINSTGTPVVAVSSATVTSSNPSIRIDGMIRVASSGLFGLTLAQSTASATQTIVSSASYMIVYDMP